MDLIPLFYRRLVFTKKTIFFVVLMLVVACITLLEAKTHLRAKVFFLHIQAPIFLAAMGVFIPMFFATRAFGEEIEAGTMTYLITRPRQKRNYLIGKFGAVVLASITLLFLGTLVSASISQNSFGDISKQLFYLNLILLIASFTYGSIFLLFGIIFKKPIVWGMIVTFIWEGAVSKAPGTIKDLTVMRYLHSLLLQFFELSKVKAFPHLTDPQTVPYSLTVLVAITILGLLASWFALQRKEFY